MVEEWFDTNALGRDIGKAPYGNSAVRDGPSGTYSVCWLQTVSGKHQMVAGYRSKRGFEYFEWEIQAKRSI